MPNVEATTRYDGSPVLKVQGVFMAGLAMHSSAEPNTLVVRAEFEERERLLEDAPETYYVTDFYRRYPLVLVRLPLLKREILRELLAGSWRMTAVKPKRPRDTNENPGDSTPRNRSAWLLRSIEAWRRGNARRTSPSRVSFKISSLNYGR